MCQLVPMNEAAAYLCVSRRTVRRLIDRRAIPFFKVSGSVRLDRQDLDNYLKRVRMEVLDYSKVAR